MKRRMTSLLAALMLLATAAVPNTVVWAEEELTLSVPGEDLVVEKGEEDGGVLDQMNSANESILGALGKKDWEELAASVKKTGDWREDLVAVAQSQVGYAEDSDGMTIYTKWAGYEENRDWTALFVNWVAEKAGLTSKEFPSDDSYEGFVAAMKGVNAVKTISRSTYPTYGDVALLNVNGKKLAAIVVYVSNGFASVIHGDDNGVVTRNTYKVDGYEFKEYVDLNELMERAGVEVGKGGDVPEIPEGGIAAWTNTNAVYMRKEPTTASKRVTTIKKPNTAVLVVSAEKQDDGYIWYGVEYKKYEGYIRGDLLKLDIAALPEKAEPAAPDMPGLNVQERVVNIEVVQGGNIKITFEIYGATKYEWYCVGTKGDGTDDVLVSSGEGTTYQTYHASTSGTYYCKATIANDFVVESKKTTVEVSTENESLITSNAILGEEVKFTFTCDSATQYQWYSVNLAGTATALKDDTVYQGAMTAYLTFLAADGLEMNTYYCVATVGEETVTSPRYQLAIKTDSILAEDLCKYVEELANMTRSQRYSIMTGEWAEISYGSGTLADAVMSHWQQEHTSVYPTLLCTCGMKSITEYHSSACLWTQEGSGTENTEAVAKIGCDFCSNYELPLATMDGYTCVYEHLRSMDTAIAQYDYLIALDKGDYFTLYDDYLNAYYAHVDGISGGTDDPLLCICTDNLVGNVANYVPSATHINTDSAKCPWYMTEEDIAKAQLQEQIDERAKTEPEFAEWAKTATTEMIARALTVKSLDHVVFEVKETTEAGTTYNVYVVRYADPVGTVDEAGFLYYGTPSRVIAWVDFTNQKVYPIYALPEGVTPPTAAAQ